MIGVFLYLKGVVCLLKLPACIFDETAAAVGTQVADIKHFGYVIIQIKFQLGPDTQSTNPIDFGSNCL